jgi:hypothetical protein
LIAGIMAMHTFSLDRHCLKDMLRRVDVAAVWLDPKAAHRRPEIKALLHNHGSHLRHRPKLIDGAQKWRKCSGWIWREPLMRALDEWRPEIVLQPDSDETFGPGFETDLSTFRASKHDLLLFNYAMPTDDQTIVPTIPMARHVKVIRWQPDLSFSPYRGYGKPNGKLLEAVATSRIQHWCFYTRALQWAKTEAMKPATRNKLRSRIRALGSPMPNLWPPQPGV